MSVIKDTPHLSSSVHKTRTSQSPFHFLDPKHRVDSFQINLATRSSLNASLLKATQKSRVALELSNSARNVIARSNQPGSKESVQVPELAAGTYFLRAILKRGEKTRYKLNYSITSLSPVDFAGNSLDTARNIVVGSTPTTLTDFVGAADTSDFYKFTVGAPGSPTARFNLSLAGAGGSSLNGSGITTTLRNEQGVQVTSPLYASYGDNISQTPLAAGTYYVGVTTDATDRGGDYSLTLSAAPIPDLAGNGLDTARSVTLNASPSLFSDFVGSGDESDFYKFTVNNSGSQFNLNLTGVGRSPLTQGSVDVKLRDAAGVQIGSPYYSSYGGGVVAFSEGLSTGTYYVQVSRYADSVFGEGPDYEMNLSIT